MDSLTTKDMNIAQYNKAELVLNEWYDNSTIYTDSLSRYSREYKDEICSAENKLQRYSLNYEKPIQSQASESYIYSIKNTNITINVVYDLGAYEEIIPPDRIQIENSTIEWSTRNSHTGTGMPHCVGKICKRTRNNNIAGKYDTIRYKRQIILSSDAPSEQKRLFRQTATPLRVAQ